MWINTFSLGRCVFWGVVLHYSHLAFSKIQSSSNSTAMSTYAQGWVHKHQVSCSMHPLYLILQTIVFSNQGLGWCSSLGAVLLVRRSRDRFPVASLDFSVTYSFWPYRGCGVDSAPSENEYQEHFLGVNAAGTWGWQPHHLHVPNVMEIWETKLPGTLWGTSGLLWDCFIFTFII
jgi:hypothetical protein